MAALQYWLWLSQLPRVNSQMKLALLSHFNGDLDSLYHADRAEYMLVEGMTRPAAESLENKSLGGADKILGGLRPPGAAGRHYSGQRLSLPSPQYL